MAIVYQNFDALAIGSTSVPGFIVGGSGQVTADGVQLGINHNAGHAWQMTEGNLLFNLFAAPVNPISVWFEFKTNGPFGVGKLCSFGLWDGVNQNSFVEFGWLTQEGDYGFSIYSNGNRGSFGNGLIDNTGLHTAESEGQVRQMRANFRWGVFFEIDVSFSTATILGTPYVVFGATVFADGIIILSGSLATTQVVGAPLGTSGATIQPSCNWLNFSASGSLNSAKLDEVTIDNGVAGPVYPNPGTPKMRATQAIAEASLLPSSAQIRATQGIVEANVLPTTAKLRITQAVIELLASSPVGSGPEYIKRRVPGSS